MQLARGREPVSGSATLGVRGDYAISSGGGAPLKTTPTGHISSLQLMLQVQVLVRLGGSSPDLDSPKGQRGEGRQAGSNGQVEVALAAWRVVHGAFRWRLRARLARITIHECGCECWYETMAPA